jgi:hypothetical protein
MVVAVRRFACALVSVMLCTALWAVAPLPAGATPVTVTVTNCDDSGAGSLRDATTTAIPGETIGFQSGLICTIILTSGTLTIGTDLTIDGTDATIAVDGNGQQQIFTGSVFAVNSGVTTTLNALTIQHGSANPFGGGIENHGTLTVTSSTIAHNSALATSLNRGGGIDNTGTLTLLNSTVSGNTVDGGGLVATDGGGGISNSGTLTVTDSTISGNTLRADAGDGARADGGGINNTGTLTVTNSTISGNSTTANGAGLGIVGGVAEGGGIANSGTLTVTSSTISGNSTTGTAGGAFRAGLFTSNGGTLTNTLVANSTTGDLGGSFIGSYNLIDDSTISNLSGSGNISAPAQLGTLGNNGGPTQTIPLLPGSPAIDAGAAVGSGPADNPVPATDQRGMARVGEPDIGAYEYQPPPNPVPNPKPGLQPGPTPNPVPNPQPAAVPAGPSPASIPTSRSPTATAPATPAPLPAPRP